MRGFILFRNGFPKLSYKESHLSPPTGESKEHAERDSEEKEIDKYKNNILTSSLIFFIY